MQFWQRNNEFVAGRQWHFGDCYGGNVVQVHDSLQAMARFIAAEPGRAGGVYILDSNLEDPLYQRQPSQVGVLS